MPCRIFIHSRVGADGVNSVVKILAPGEAPTLPVAMPYEGFPMKLRYSVNSPFARKVLMLAHEAGLAGRLELVATDAFADASLRQLNPLSKVPALVLDDGSVLYDSPVIAEYLDSLHGGRPLFPAAGPQRWGALRLQALGDGICDAALLRRMETLRPAGLQSADWIERQRLAMTAGLDELERRVAELEGEPTIGSLAAAAALGYADLRWASDDWRAGRPRLAAWLAGFAERDSFRLTRPPAP
jgi:glutathione S-transferase